MEPDDEPELPLDTPTQPNDSEQTATRPLEMQVCIGYCPNCNICKER